MCNVAQCVRTFIQALGHAAKRKGKPHNGTFHAMPGCKKRLKSSNIAEIESDTDLRNIPRNIFIELQRVAVHLTENLARNTTCNAELCSQPIRCQARSPCDGSPKTLVT